MASKKSHPKVAIVVPVFNQKDLIIRFIESLREQDYPNFTLIVVDDASSDGTYTTLTKDYPEVTTLKGNGNLWWSGGTNKGIKCAIKDGADYILTINHDVTIGKDYISSLVTFAKKYPHALVGSMVVDRQKPDSVWFFGASYSKRTGENSHVLGKVSDFKEPQKSTWLTGMGVLVPIEVFDIIGYYDEENFPLYFGDADFSERARRAGYDLWVNQKSVVYGDINENWIGRNVRRPKLRFIYDLFTLINSPFQWKTRSLYYKKYWPGNYRLALFKVYTIGSAGIYFAYAKGLIRGALGIEPRW